MLKPRCVMSAPEPILQMSLLGETGEVVVQVYREWAILTVRNPEEERLGAVRLTQAQAQVLADVLQHVPGEEWDDA